MERKASEFQKFKITKGKKLSPITRHRLNIQGWDNIDDDYLAETAFWLRLAPFLCAILAGIGTTLASPLILWILMPIAALGAMFKVHIFDQIYNYGIRYLLSTRPLPKRAVQTRFACGLGAVFLGSAAISFQSEAFIAGYFIGYAFTAVAVLVGTTDICIPSRIFNALFRRS